MNRGHLIAKVDPLGLMQRPKPKLMELGYMGLGDEDLDTEFYTASRVDAIPRRARLRDIIGLMEQVFAGTIGAEFAHVSNTDERLWLQDQFLAGRALGKLRRKVSSVFCTPSTWARSASRWKVAMR
jgi:2-oxoglutarate dehydrogenase E1 component